MIPTFCNNTLPPSIKNTFAVFRCLPSCFPSPSLAPRHEYRMLDKSWSSKILGVHSKGFPEFSWMDWSRRPADMVSHLSRNVGLICSGQMISSCSHLSCDYWHVINSDRVMTCPGCNHSSTEKPSKVFQRRLNQWTHAESGKNKLIKQPN